MNKKPMKENSKDNNDNPNSLKKTPLIHLLYAIATGGGLGYLPIVPGTWGTLGGIILYVLIWTFSWPVYIIVTLITFFVGCWICEKVSQDMGICDHGSVVWDEIVGYCISMFGVPFGLYWMFAGFVLFRLFDIIKPWPICVVDRKMKNGFGMMFDDALAGIAVCAILNIAKLFIH